MRTNGHSWHAWVAMALLGLCAVSMPACHSYHIEASIENRTGAPITLLEVDYPTASFGSDIVPADAVFHHRFQTRDSGPITVEYTGAHGRQIQVKGPTLHEKQEGSIEIVLLPDGKVEFHPALNPPQ
jgi:hypothetical protein